MRYVIKDIDDRSQQRNFEYKDFKKVTIYFSQGEKQEVYENKFTNIVIFLSEFEDFLDDVDNGEIACWYWGFAPFAFGKLEGGRLKLSSHSGKEFDEHVYDYTEKDDLENIKSKLKKDIKKFGRLMKK